MFKKILLCVPIEPLFILSSAASFQCVVELGRQTQGCRPRLDVLNLGLGTLLG